VAAWPLGTRKSARRSCERPGAFGEGWGIQRLRPADLRFFSHWAHPDGRGGPNDRIRLDQIAGVNLCFGAWLYGKDRASPHAIEIGEVVIERLP
jgi:hypothetical protein